MHFAPDGEHLVSASEDQTVKIWKVYRETRNVSPVRAFNGGLSAVVALAISHDGNLVAAANQESQIRVWDLAKQTKNPSITLSTPNESVSTLTFSPMNDELIYAGTMEGSLIEWQLPSTEPVSKVEAPADVFKIFFSADSDQILFALVNDARSGSIVKYRARGLQQLPNRYEARAPIRDAVAVSANEIVLAGDGIVFRNDGPEKNILEFDTSFNLERLCLLDQSRFALSAGEYPIQVHKRNGGGLWSLNGLARIPEHFVVMPRSQSVLLALRNQNSAGLEHGALTVLSRDLKVAATVAFPFGESHLSSVVLDVAVTDDESHIAASLENGQIILWDSSLKFDRVLSNGHGNDRALAITFSSDSRQLVAASESGEIRLFDLVAKTHETVWSNPGGQSR